MAGTSLKCSSFIAVSLVLSYCCSGTRAQPRMTVEEERGLSPFTGVAVFAPFTVLVVPQADAYRVLLKAEQEILDIIGTSVDGNGTLSITAEGNFSTNYEVQITVFVPGDSVTSLIAYGPQADLIVQKGLTVENLRIETGLASNRVYLGYSTISGELEISVKSARSFIVVEGEINNAVVTSAKGSRSIVHVGRIQDSVQVDLNGFMDMYVAQSANSVIKGENRGIGSRVYYDRGRCEVAGCVQRTNYDIMAAPPVSWTCGLQGEGTFTPANQDGAIVAVQIMSGGGFNMNGGTQRASSSLGARSQDGIAYSHGAATQSGSTATATATSMSSSSSGASSSVSVAVAGGGRANEARTSVTMDGIDQGSRARGPAMSRTLMQSVYLRNVTTNEKIASISTIPCLSDQ